jgi:hypothetical protein
MIMTRIMSIEDAIIYNLPELPSCNHGCLWEEVQSICVQYAKDRSQTICNVSLYLLAKGQVVVVAAVLFLPLTRLDSYMAIAL